MRLQTYDRLMNTTKAPSFLAQLIEALAPRENRLIAAVAFVRTFQQGLKGSAYIGAGGTLFFTVTDVLATDWTIVAIAAILTVGSALVSGGTAYFDVLANGLSDKYAKAMIQTIAKTGDTGDASLKSAITDAAKAIEN